MAKIPDDDIFTVDAVARLLGYTQVKTFRRHTMRGFYPRPLGIGHNQYYTRADVVVMLDYCGRWYPEGASPDDGKENHPPKTGRKGTNSVTKGTKGDETG